MDDQELIDRFVREGSQDAFREVVARHTNLVFACAKQRLLGDAHAAEDVTQAVFLALAMKAGDLRPGTSLSGWLFNTARYVALRYQRGERRRKEREMYASAQPEGAPGNDAAWQDVEPLLATALDSLSNTDREAVLLRFYRQASHKEVAVSMRITEENARQRVNRALERLHRFFVGKGVSMTVSSLTLMLGTRAAETAPAGLAAASASTALAGLKGTMATTGALVLAKGAIQMIVWSKVKTVLIATTAALILTGGTTVALRLVHSSGGENRQVGQQTTTGVASEIAPEPMRPETPVVQTSPPPVVSTPLPGTTNSSGVTRVSNSVVGTNVSVQATVAISPLFGSEAELEATAKQVLLIEDNAERLQAIRQRLGMNITDEVYRKAVVAYANRAKTKYLFQGIVSEWVKEDPKAVFLWTMRLPGVSEMKAKAMASWVDRDRDAALASARQYMSVEEVNKIIANERRPVRNPTDTDRLVEKGEFAELIRRCENEKDPTVRGMGIQGWVHRWAEKDPHAAAECALGLAKEGPVAHYRDMTVATAVDKWADSDPDAALAWASAVTNEADRVTALTAALPGWARKHPDDPLDISALPTNARSNVIVRVAEDWAKRNPSAAMEFASGLGDQTLKERAALSVVRVWAEKDPDGAVRWASTMPPGAIRDLGMETIAPIVGAYDLPKAEALTKDIRDEVRRRDITERLISAAMANDPVRALRLADGMPRVDYMTVSGWVFQARKGKPLAALRVWVEKAQKEGRIEYPSYGSAEGTDPAVVRAWEKNAAESGYRFILQTIGKAEKEND